MASSSNLRPGLKIFQQFTTISGTPPATNLPVLLIGLNRSLNYQIDAGAGDYNAGTPLTAVDFANWQGGVVENETASPALLQPAIFVTHPTLGTAEITTGVSFANLDESATTPNFSIAAGASATFEIASGTAGVFAVDTDTPTESSFTDSSADFVIDQVGDGDIIKVNGVSTYKVASGGLISDDQLLVTRLDKGPSTIGAVEAAKILVEPEDANGIRTLRSTSTAFNTAGGFGSTGTGVKQGDVLFLDHWSIRSQGIGLEFDQVGQSEGSLLSSPAIAVASNQRVVTLPSAGTTVTVWDNAAFTGTIFFTQNENAEYRPVFYTVSDETAATDQHIVQDFASGDLPDYVDADPNEGVAFRAYTYAPRAGASGTTGSFSAADAAGLRNFIDTAITGFPGTVEVGDHILIKDTDGIYRPVFEITNAGNLTSPSPSGHSPGTDNTLVVREFGEMYSDTLSASNVDYVICNPGSPLTGDTADIGAENVSGERVLTANGSTDFGADGVAAGDLVFSDAGVLLFVVITQDSATQLTVKDHPNKGIVLQSNETIEDIGFSVRRPLRADFTVKRVVNDSTLEITQLSTSPNNVPDTQTVKGAIYFQTAVDIAASPDVLGDDILLVGSADAASSLNYTVEKTLSGASLEGTVKLSYAEILNTSTDTFIRVTASTYQSLLGDPVPDNPLALAAQLATQNTNTEVYCLQVGDNNVTAWNTAFAAAASDAVYSIVPLTQDDLVLSAAQTHVLTQSLPVNKRERILYQSKWHVTQEDKSSLQSGDAPMISRTDPGGVQTVTVQRDLTAVDDIIVGDEFSGTAFDGTTLIDFSGRITVVNVVGSTTTLTMIPDGNIAKGVTDLTVTAYTIKSKLLSTTEFRDSIAAYTDAISERRVRNIFPSRCLLTFTDTTGFYGTVNEDVVDYQAGMQYACAIEAAKRAEYGPARPLTKVAGSGIQSIIDPFSGSADDQDVIINAGNYYMQQPGGEGATVSAIRALTTDTTAVEFYEDAVTTQIDNFARLLRAAIRPILGTYIRDEGFYDVLSGIQQGVRNSILEQKHIKSIKLNKIEDDPDQPDGFIMEYQVEPFFSASQGTIFIFI